MAERWVDLRLPDGVVLTRAELLTLIDALNAEVKRIVSERK